MLKKLLSAFLVLLIMTAASSARVFASANDGDKKTNADKPEKQIKESEKKDLSFILKNKSEISDLKFTKKDTLAEYERTKAQGRKFSTTTKILIGAGIAAAIVAVVVLVAKKGARDASPF